MIIVRRFKKLGHFDLLERMEQDLNTQNDKNLFFEYMDEFKMRLLESVSEGASFKFKASAQDLMNRFNKKMSADSSFASAQDLQQFKEIADSVLFPNK